MGNISAITRNGLQETVDDNNIFGSIDNLSFSLSGNKVTGVAESSMEDKGYKGTGGSISYDGVGRMISHTGKFSNITYNYLDLPSNIETSLGNIEYIYDADGVKLESRSTTSGQLVIKSYQDGLEYENEVLNQIHHEEGRIVFDSEDPTFAEYNIKDHLGNIRTRYGDKDADGVLIYSPYNDEGNEVFGSNHYYPFGMETEGPWMKQSGLYNAYRYNGKELVDSIGLYDYGARFYDPSVGRFTSVDPLTEERNWLTPYNYVQNNPLIRIDPTGALDTLPGAFTGTKQPANSESSGDIVTDIKSALNYAAKLFSWTAKETATAIDQTQMEGAVEKTLDGNYQEAAIAIVVTVAEKATKLPVLKQGTKEWINAVKDLSSNNKKKMNFRVNTASDAKQLLKESRGDMNRYKQYAKDKGVTYKKGYEVHNQQNARELGAGNNLQHIKWKDGKAGGHIFYNKPN